MNTKAKFYTFIQNNSGGSFNISKTEGICETVIIEAIDADEANHRAENIGLYFDGCENDMDCDCCGDRWYKTYDGDGTETPEFYGEKIEYAVGSSYRKYCFVHYLNGDFKKYDFKEDK